MTLSVRALRPFAQQAARLTTRPSATSNTGFVARRFASSADSPILYSAHATAVGARTGHVEAENLKVDLTTSKKLGGPGDAGKTNPEELFAAGYAACFQASMVVAAGQMDIKMPTKREDSVVESTVHLVGSLKPVDLQIKVELLVKVKGVSKGDLDKLVDAAKGICPYSRATEGNVYTTIECEEMK